jgi:hypothetical protein
MYHNNEYKYEGFSNISETNIGNKSCEKVKGFDGLICSADSKYTPIDTISNSKGCNNCKYNGYTNSKGNICLDATQIKLLTTRGGNASG